MDDYIRTPTLPEKYPKYRALYSTTLNALMDADTGVPQRFLGLERTGSLRLNRVSESFARAPQNT